MASQLRKVTDYESSQVDKEAKALVEIIVEQESAIRFKQFDNDVAWKIGTTIREGFVAAWDKKKIGVVIAVELFNDHSLFRCTVGAAPAVGPDNW